MRLFLLLELELAEIHDAADRWIGVRLDLDQIHSGFLGHAQGFVPCQHAGLFPFCANYAHLRNTNLLVLAISLFGGDNSFSAKPLNL